MLDPSYSLKNEVTKLLEIAVVIIVLIGLKTLMDALPLFKSKAVLSD